MTTRDGENVLADHEPRQCRNGHPFTKGTFMRGGWTPCDCEGAIGGGHWTVFCRRCDDRILAGHVGPPPDDRPWNPRPLTSS